MVKRELNYFIYIIKAHKSLFVIPLIVALFIIGEFSIGMDTIAEGSLVLLLFPLINLPMLSVMSVIGSLEQKELFITLPMYHWNVGFLRPLILNLVISVLFAVVIVTYLENNQFLSVFSSSLLYLSITVFLITLLKHSGFGLGISLGYLIFGLFTTGAGQGPFYLTQWYRPRLMSSQNDYVFIQLTAVLVIHLFTVIFIKYRSRYHLG